MNDFDDFPIIAQARAVAAAQWHKYDAETEIRSAKFLKELRTTKDTPQSATAHVIFAAPQLPLPPLDRLTPPVALPRLSLVRSLWLRSQARAKRIYADDLADAVHAAITWSFIDRGSLRKDTPQTPRPLSADYCYDAVLLHAQHETPHRIGLHFILHLPVGATTQHDVLAWVQPILLQHFQLDARHLDLVITRVVDEAPQARGHFAVEIWRNPDERAETEAA